MTPRFPLALPVLAALLALTSPLHALSDRKPLLEATTKLVSKEQQRIAKAEGKILKLEGKIAAKQQLILDNEDAEDEALDTVELLEHLLDVAEEDLLDALALPEATEQQIDLKKAEVKHAQLGVKLANKEIKLYEKQVSKAVKTILKSDKQITKSEAQITALEGEIDAAEQQIALLESPFDFDARRNPAALVRLVDGAGTPMPNIQVMLLPEMLPPKGMGSQRIELRGSGEILARGRTDASGEAHLLLDLPEDVTVVDVVVIAKNRAGPYTYPELRERWGAFAPAARLGVPVDQLDGVTLELPLEE